MTTHAILLAGGDGHRFGGELPKQFVRLAGEQIIVHSARAMASAGVDRMVVVAHPDWLAETAAALDGAGLRIPVSVVAGGSTRNASTWNGLRSLEAAADDIVVVHDAVRPLVPVEVVRGAIEPVAAGLADSTDTVIPSADTLVITDGDAVVEIPDRSRYRRGQTPQVFRAGILQAAYQAALAADDLGSTDDCSLVLRHVPFARVLAVPGDEVNLKITTRIDMVLADRMIQLRSLDPASLVQASRTLQDARVLIIGGTSGIGAAIADAATEAGASVEVDGRSRGLDVRDGAAVQSRLDAASERLGGLDHVVCTAGILHIGSIADATPEQLAEVIDVNVTGTLHVARAAFSHLQQSSGSFTAFASSSFTRGRANYVTYSASKAAVVNLIQGLAEEWAEHGIRVNGVSPERTDTPMRQRAFPGESTDDMLTASEVAVATLRLLRSDMTGQVLDVRRNDQA